MLASRDATHRNPSWATSAKHSHTQYRPEFPVLADKPDMMKQLKYECKEKLAIIPDEATTSTNLSTTTVMNIPSQILPVYSTTSNYQNHHDHQQNQPARESLTHPTKIHQEMTDFKKQCTRKQQTNKNTPGNDNCKKQRTRKQQTNKNTPGNDKPT